MATNINTFTGTLLTTVADGTIDTTHSTLKFPGKGYNNYGEPVLEDILWTATNFAGPTQPNLPLTGQTWYNTNTQVLNIYNGTAWVAAGGVLVSATKPTTGSNVGAFWYDSLNLQLYIWDGTQWDLLGPLGSAINQDPSNPVTPSFSQVDAARLSDGASLHQVWRITIGGLLFAIISKDAAFIPSPSLSGFAVIYPGINFNSNVAGITISGDSTLFKSTKTNIHAADNTYNLGSSSNRFADFYSVNGAFSNTLEVGSTTGNYSLNVNGTTFLDGVTTFGAGTSGAPPIQLTSGTLTAAPQSGALEFDGYNLYITLTQNGSLGRVAILAGMVGDVAAIPNTLALRDSTASIYANLFVGTATSALYADVAERYHTDINVTPGDVVILGGEYEITTTIYNSDPNVFGVISTDPAYMLNADAGSDNEYPYVALVGRVPCKVVGRVAKGQRLVTSSIAGVAIAEVQYQPYTSFARALENKTTDGVGLIEVVLSGRN